MKSKDRILDDIHAIREQIEEEMRGLTPQQRVEKFREDTREIIEKYHLKVVKKAS